MGKCNQFAQGTSWRTWESCSTTPHYKIPEFLPNAHKMIDWKSKALPLDAIHLGV